MSRRAQRQKHGVGDHSRAGKDEAITRPGLGTWVLAATVAIAAALLAGGLAACGAKDDGPAVVDVGPAAIGKEAVAHWAHVLGQSGAFQGLGGEPRGSAKERAIAVLISAAWINGEAVREQLSPSGVEVHKAVREREEANGRSEFLSALRAAGQTMADVELEARTELAAKAIGRRLGLQEGQVSQTEIARFYRRNRKSFVEPEERYVELIENLPSAAAATALVSRIGTGSGFAKRALKEALARGGGAENPADIKSVTDAIFAARPGVASRPMRLNNAWTVFLVTKVTPPKRKPLSRVRGEIAGRLITQHRRESRASFEREYRTRWRAGTHCRPGYVVQKCAEYAGPQTSEASPFPSE